MQKALQPMVRMRIIRNYVKVKIQVDTQTSLIHFVFNGLARNQVEATARAFPTQPIVPGMALVALDDIPHDCDAMTFHGGGGKQIAVTVTGGGIYSNSPDAPPPSSCYSGIREGTIDLYVTEGGINVVGEWGVKGNSGTQVPVNATEGVTPISVPPVPVPVCPTTSSGQIKVTNGNTETKGPGLYDSIDVQGGVLTLTQGLYCITGDVKTNGGTISNTGNGVMFYMKGGSFALGGNTNVDLCGLNRDKSPPSCPSQRIQPGSTILAACWFTWQPIMQTR